MPYSNYYGKTLFDEMTDKKLWNDGYTEGVDTKVWEITEFDRDITGDRKDRW